MSMMLQALSVWRAMSPMLQVRMVTVYKQLWSREAAQPRCQLLASTSIND